jgi:hypothetical protein
LIRDGYVAKCITIINDLKYHPLPFHLAGFFLRIASPGQVTRCRRDITSEQWWILVRMALCSAIYLDSDEFDEAVEIHMPQDISEYELRFLETCLGEALDKFGKSNPINFSVSRGGGPVCLIIYGLVPAGSSLCPMQSPYVLDGVTDANARCGRRHSSSVVRLPTRDLFN